MRSASEKGVRIRSVARAGTRRIALVICAVAWMACNLSSETPAPEATRVAAVEPVVEVQTARIRRGSIVQRISAPGSIVAHREALIGTEVRGVLAQIYVDEGSRVEKGDPLFEIDPAPYRLYLGRAEAALDRARAERRQLESDLKRGRVLRQKHVMAEQETDRIATGLEVAEAAEREAAQAVAMARLDLDRTTVMAPFAGSITQRMVDEGTTALVQPQTIVLVLQETQDLEAIATIAEIHFSAIRPGDIALLYVDGLPLPISSEVEAVGDAIDPATRTFRVRMRVPNPDRVLKAGLFTRVEILPQAKSEVLLAPRTALRTQDGATHVLVVRDGVAVENRIEIGLISEDAVEVLAGLHVDDEVVDGDSARTLGPGMRVRPSAAGSPGSSRSISTAADDGNAGERDSPRSLGP